MTRWFSGKIGPCHGPAPGSIPGRVNSLHRAFFSKRAARSSAASSCFLFIYFARPRLSIPRSSCPRGPVAFYITRVSSMGDASLDILIVGANVTRESTCWRVGAGQGRSAPPSLASFSPHPPSSPFVVAFGVKTLAQPHRGYESL